MKQSLVFCKKKEIIDKELAIKLKEAKGMRNILAHEYGEVDNSVVYSAVKDELHVDIEKFIISIKILHEAYVAKSFISISVHNSSY